jgi:hypothetical protein
VNTSIAIILGAAFPGEREFLAVRKTIHSNGERPGPKREFAFMYQNVSNSG